jgi:hypothetical protein
MPPNIHPAALPIEDLLADCEVRHLRRSGPGGQHRNKVETAVQLRHLSTDVRAEANERRSQAVNHKVAVRRLRVNLALEVRLARRPQESPSQLWRTRVAGGRISVSAAHADFPGLLAEALDVIEASEADLKRAAVALGSTASQIVRFLRKEPRAMAMFNAWRKERGLPSFH